MIKLKLLVILFGLFHTFYFGSILFTALYEIQTERTNQIQTLLNKI